MTPYWFLDDLSVVLEDGISADQQVPFDALLLESLEKFFHLAPACVLP